MAANPPPPDNLDLEAKLNQLRAILQSLGAVALAYSGGVDSSYLLAACIDVLGSERVLALTVDSPLMSRAELRTAREIATQLGARHQVVTIDELALTDVRANRPDRCYHCKRARFETLATVARAAGDLKVIHGENADDRFDYRPGSAAARELRVRAPLAEAGMTKADIRALSRQRGLPTWDHPAAACLASRIPYGTALTRDALERVEQAEAALQALLPGQQLRVRDHYPIARVEVPDGMLERIVEPSLRSAIVERLHAAGYRYVTLDLEGYRMGSLNESIT